MRCQAPLRSGRAEDARRRLRPLPKQFVPKLTARWAWGGMVAKEETRMVGTRSERLRGAARRVRRPAREHVPHHPGWPAHPPRQTARWRACVHPRSARLSRDCRYRRSAPGSASGPCHRECAASPRQAGLRCESLRVSRGRPPRPLRRANRALRRWPCRSPAHRRVCRWSLGVGPGTV